MERRGFLGRLLGGLAVAAVPQVASVAPVRPTWLHPRWMWHEGLRDWVRMMREAPSHVVGSWNPDGQPPPHPTGPYIRQVTLTELRAIAAEKPASRVFYKYGLWPHELLDAMGVKG